MREASFTTALTREDADRGAADRGRRRPRRRRAARAARATRAQPLTNATRVDGQHRARSSAAAASSRSRSQNAEDAGAVAVVVYNNARRADRDERRRERRPHPRRDDRHRRWPAAPRPRCCGHATSHGQARRRRRSCRSRRRQHHGRLLVARPVRDRREFLEARRHGAGRRHPGRPDADVANGVRGETYQYHLRNVASGARGRGGRGAAQGGASRTGRRPC